MDIFDVFSNRHSIRAFTDQPIPDDVIKKIHEAVNRAPSAGNLQACDIYQVGKREHKQALMHASYDQEFLIQAPVVLVFCAVPARSAVRYAERGASLQPLPVHLPCWQRQRLDWVVFGWEHSMKTRCTRSLELSQGIDQLPYCRLDIRVRHPAFAQDGHWRRSSIKSDRIASI